MASSISGASDPVIRTISIADVVDALALGLRDFQKQPVFGLVLGAACAAIGIGILAMLYALGMPYFAYPLAAGFALVAPFFAAGLYEVSRRIEQGLPVTGSDVWEYVKGRSEVRWLGFATLFILIMWMYQVRFLMALFLGYSGMAATLGEFVNMVLSTNEGLVFLLVGNVVGAILATVLYSVSVVSFPLVLDREIDVVTAIVTSVKAVAANPVPMLFNAAVIAALLVVGAVPMFLGLIVILPVLGHATWHLYRRVIVPVARAA